MKVKVCTGIRCSEKFSEYILERLENDKKFYGAGDNLIIEKSPCMGNCLKGPNITIDKNIHEYMTPAKASELVFNNKKKK